MTEAQIIDQIRQKTGAGLGACAEALRLARLHVDDFAVELLRTRGQAVVHMHYAGQFCQRCWKVFEQDGRSS